MKNTFKYLTSMPLAYDFRAEGIEKRITQFSEHSLQNLVNLCYLWCNFIFCVLICLIWCILWETHGRASLLASIFCLLSLYHSMV